MADLKIVLARCREDIVVLENRIKQLEEALRKARHEVATVHGLVVCDGEALAETFQLDTSTALSEIDAALSPAKPQRRRNR